MEVVNRLAKDSNYEGSIGKGLTAYNLSLRLIW